MNLVLNVLLSACVIQLASGDREELIQRAKLAEQAERYDDMAEAMKKVVETGTPLGKEERTLFLVANTNVVDARRASWRGMSHIEAKTTDEDTRAGIRVHMRRVKDELLDQGNDVQDLLHDYLIIPGETGNEGGVFYLTMKGDFYRYMAEVSGGVNRAELAHDADDAYKAALEVSVQELQPTNPTRLTLDLNYSIFLHDIGDNAEKACEVSKASFDAAIAELDTLSEDSYKDTTLIMQQLQDNRDLWCPGPGDVNRKPEYNGNIAVV